MEIINKPEKIYLNTGLPAWEEDVDWNERGLFREHITWSENRVMKSDLPYYSKELMFEFAEWIGIRNYSYYNSVDETPSWFNSKNHSLDCNTEQLFKEFLKDREE